MSDTTLIDVYAKVIQSRLNVSMFVGLEEQAWFKDAPPTQDTRRPRDYFAEAMRELDEFLGGSA